MPIVISHRDVVNQSNQVFNQFGESKWIPFAKENAKLKRRNSNELKNSGIGKVMVSVAMGESTENALPHLKKYRDRYILLTCDKGFGALLEHGVKADYVMICDANIPYKWLEPYVNETKDVNLISTVYGNIEWTTKWLGEKYFFINKDAIDSQKRFIPIFGDDSIRIIPASTNVSNAMIVFMTGGDDTNNINWAGYDKYLLTGYDYSWRPFGNYYAWSDPKPKRYYMTHRTIRDLNNQKCLTSENLFFSAKWMYSYLTTFNFPVINCSGRGLLLIPLQGDIEINLNAIIPDNRLSVLVREAYANACRASDDFQKARKLFEQSREVIYVNR